MILVILGTQDKPFDRLLKKIDELIENKKITDKVFVQSGTTKYISKNMDINPFIPMEEFDKIIKKADFIITHGGVGSILSSLRNNKKVIAVPRLAKYGEHENDHQLEIINEFEKMNYILACTELDNLEYVLEKVEKFEPKKYKSNNSKMIKIIENYIDNL